MSQRLPDHLDPWRFADLGKVVEGGVLPLEGMSRLRECLREDSGEAVFDLSFARDEQRRAVVTGRIRAQLRLQCQRCLETVVHGVDAEVSIAFVEGYDQAAQLPDSLDPCLVEEGGRVRLLDLIEDELLLQLPQVAMHEAGSCPVMLTGTTGEKPSQTDVQPENNPFALLAGLKGKQD